MQCRKCKHAESTTSFAGKPVCADCASVLEKVNPSKLVAFLAETQRQPANDLLTIPLAAKRLSISTRTLYRLIQRGDIAAIGLGKSIRLEPAELDRYLCRQGPRVGLFG